MAWFALFIGCGVMLHEAQVTLKDASQRLAVGRRVFVLDEQAWQVFDQALSRPATEVPGLRELLSAPTVLDQDAAEPPSSRAGR